MTDRWDVERALRNSGLPGIARGVAFALLTRSDARTAEIPAQYAPSLSRLALDSGWSRSSVRAALNELERDGWITRHRDIARSWAEGLPTGYTFHVPSRAGGALGQDVPYSGGALPVGQETARSRAPRAPGSELTRPIPERSSNDDRHWFDKFWSAWPRRTHKAAARRAWASVVTNEADPGELIAAAARYAASLNGADLKFCCEAARWLSERRWLDYPPERKADLGGS